MLCSTRTRYEHENYLIDNRIVLGGKHKTYQLVCRGIHYYNRYNIRARRMHVVWF